jgi:hypothetical protein
VTPMSGYAALARGWQVWSLVARHPCDGGNSARRLHCPRRANPMLEKVGGGQLAQWNQVRRSDGVVDKAATSQVGMGNRRFLDAKTVRMDGCP